MFDASNLKVDLSADTLVEYATTILTFVRTNLQEYIDTRSIRDEIEDLICLIIAYRFLLNLLVLIYGYGPIRVLYDFYKTVTSQITHRLLSLPVLREKVQKQVADTRAIIENEFIKNPRGATYRSIPEHGLTDNQVKRKLDTLAKEKAANWQGGQVSGAVYFGDDKVAKLQADTYYKFCFANQLHPDAFPGVRQMEAEVVSMVLKLFNAPATGCGTTTSGGTESLLLACLAAREKAFSERGITEPEIIAPVSIHAAVFKASKYFKMKLRLVDLNDDFTVNVAQVKRLINRNTCFIMGSAPNFPYGTIDNIEALSDLAVRYDIPLHVDCCLGSFIVAYYSRAFGEELPSFDFSLPGVTSISCDTHKYGFTPKGSSVILYRHPNYRRYQYFVSTEWTGGLYGSPTLAGSRPGALTAGTWATMIAIGNDGYINSCREIVLAARRLKQAIHDEIPALEVIGDPLVSVVAFKSDKLNVHTLSDNMTKRGWHLSALQRPSAVHLCVTRLSVPVIEDLINDLKVEVDELLEKHEEVESTTAQLYGVANSLTVNSVADDIISAFLDVLYQDEKST
ncbi:DEKNAAC100525 [Brettanomyces naardenensis]|uniref:sphinganine-1-phosphate aldolase n=1 Tax=Brettanomyces naardenensis TaxID=13370 RepID=A0A448YGB6_BRENA|nr:DEKNAAC100525 [Brettanomyces naardenensis]